MGKRSTFKRVKGDFYETPLKAMEPLISYIKDVKFYIDPCYGDGKIEDNLEQLLPEITCIGAFDVEEEHKVNHPHLIMADATTHKYGQGYMFITNPPWSRHLLHDIIENLRCQGDVWLLFDADWMHTKQAIPYLKYCKMIVSVGRVKWIEDSKHTGKDNAAWYLFTKEETDTIFKGLT